MTATLQISDKKAMIVGTIDFENVLALKTLGEVYIAEQTEITFDFGKVTRANSAGLTLMLSWIRYAKGLQKSVAFSQVPTALQIMANTCELTVILGI